MVISIAIQKGGSGKTTTAINLAAALQYKGHKVLLVDLDPQANLTQALGILEEPDRSIYHLLLEAANGEKVKLKNILQQTPAGLDLIPASLELASAEIELVNKYRREEIFKQLLKPLKKKYDYIFIDCPPAIGILTVSALVASRYVLMPMQAEFLPLRGVKSFQRFFKTIQGQLNKKVEILGFVLTQFDSRKTMHQHIRQQLEDNFEEAVFETTIRSNIALAQAQQKGVDIFKYDKTSNGALDYMNLAREFLEYV